MHCLNCRYFDKNDTQNAYGTFDPQDKDFHCTHECSLTTNEINELVSLTGKPRETGE